MKKHSSCEIEDFVEIHLCKLRGTTMFRYYTVVAQHLRKVVRACYMCLILMKDIGRSLPPLDVVRVNTTVFNNNNAAH